VRKGAQLQKLRLNAIHLCAHRAQRSRHHCFLSTQPKSDLFDLGQLKVPNSGKSGFGGHGAAREYLFTLGRVWRP